MESLNIGTLNIQGCQDKTKQLSIYQDALNYDLQILGLTETHVKEERIKFVTVKSELRTCNYQVYYSGIKGKNTFSGTALVIEESLKRRFKQISNRITTAIVQLKDEKIMNIVAADAQTLVKSEKIPK